MKSTKFRGCTVVLAGLVLGLFQAIAALPAGMAQTQKAVAAHAAPLPKIVEKDGRYALVVDGEPYLMLGVQARRWKENQGLCRPWSPQTDTSPDPT